MNMRINRKLFFTLLLLFILFSVSDGSSKAQTIPPEVEILLADNPDDCLLLETVYVDGENYIFIDGRNNTGRVKFTDSTGQIQRSLISTIPLPNAASLPCDYPVSPFGADRVVLTDNYLYALPANWSDSLAEKFEPEAGDFLERIPGMGIVPSGLFSDSSSNVWGFLDSSLFEIDVENPRVLNLAGSVPLIDCAAWSPAGFVVISQPDIILVDSTGIIRWRVGLDGVTDYFLSPVDLACGSDGTIAVAAVTCGNADETTVSEYFSFRTELIRMDETEVLWDIEDSFRSTFQTGSVILILDISGNVTDAIDFPGMPVSIDVDDIGRIHVLHSDSNGWIVTVLDPRLNQGFTSCEIPFGNPRLKSPHALALNPENRLIWDDLITEDFTVSWGINCLADQEGIFALGADSDPVDIIYSDPNLETIRLVNALVMDSSGDMWLSCQDYSFDFYAADPETSDITVKTNRLLGISNSGEVLLNIEQGPIESVAELHLAAQGLLGVFASPDPGVKWGFFSPDGSFSQMPTFLDGYSVLNANLGTNGSANLGWFLVEREEKVSGRFVEFSEDWTTTLENHKLTALECRLLDSSPITGVTYITVDDGEIFRLDNSFNVTGVYSNRLESGAVCHPLDSAVAENSSLDILDREHRAIIRINPGAFTAPQVATSNEIDEALIIIRSAMYEYLENNHVYPPATPDILEEILEFNEREIVRRAFLGGRIYNYEPHDTGYYFTAWSAEPDQSVLLCDQTSEETI